MIFQRKLKLIPPEDYLDKEPEYLSVGTLVEHHVDGECWSKFYVGYRPRGWFTGAYDTYYYEKESTDGPTEED